MRQCARFPLIISRFKTLIIHVTLCLYRTKYGVVKEASPEENQDEDKAQENNSAALTALGGYGGDSDSSD